MTTVWTIGHSTLSIDEFLETLQSFRIEVLVDVRRFPASRRNPQYGTVPLKKSLHHAGIAYLYLGDELGGFREPRTDSPNVGLRNATFRGYADWMDGATFRQGVTALLEAGGARRACVMCAERPLANCHRRLLGDYLALVEGVEVVDIHDPGEGRAHAPSRGVARTEKGLVYEVPPRAQPLESFDG